MKNKKEASQCLDYILKTINQMTTGNLEHHRNAIKYNLNKLKKYLNK